MTIINLIEQILDQWFQSIDNDCYITVSLPINLFRPIQEDHQALKNYSQVAKLTNYNFRYYSVYGIILNVECHSLDFIKIEHKDTPQWLIREIQNKLTPLL